MPNMINYANPQNPNYSGVTINISNPAVNMPPQGCQPCPNPAEPYNPAYAQNQYLNQNPFGYNPYVQNPMPPADYGYGYNPQNAYNGNNYYNGSNGAYPPQYYMNNYTYNGYPSNTVQRPDINSDGYPQDQLNQPANVGDTASYLPVPENVESENTKNAENLDKSDKIIENLDERAQEIKSEQKDKKKVKVVALTNEYIMSLENYLNNPNKEIRLMASKEILKRLDEDSDRYDDAALNALLNKMLQDPDKLVRIAAMSAFSSGLASGNEYTTQLLTEIQQNPNSDPEDVTEAAAILLRQSADTEEKYVSPENRQKTEMKVKKEVQDSSEKNEENIDSDITPMLNNETGVNQ